MRLYLMRHGATVGNELHRYVGRATDEPLSPQGVAQCARAGACADVRLVYVSPLRRAVETARLCFPEAQLEAVPGLEEYDFGAFEGKSADDLADDAAYRAWVEGWCRGRCPGGDSRESYVSRSNSALARVLREARARGDKSVVVVAHGGTIMAALSAWASVVPAGGDRYFGWHVGTCAGYTAAVRWDDTQVSLDEPRHFDQVAGLLGL